VTFPTEKLARLAAELVALSAAYGILRRSGWYNFTAHEIEGLNVVILLVGEIYAVLLAFAIFVIWSQFTEVENSVMRECDSLDDVLRFSQYLNADARAAIRRGIANYVQHVLKYEWQSLGDGRIDKQAEEFFSRFMQSVIEVKPASEAERMLYVRLLDMAQKSSNCRDERITKSLTRLPPTLGGLVNTIALVLVLRVFVYPFHHWLAGLSCLVVISSVLFLANFVMMDTDNPLVGTWNVSPKPFSELKL